MCSCFAECFLLARCDALLAAVRDGAAVPQVVVVGDACEAGDDVVVATLDAMRTTEEGKVLFPDILFAAGIL